MGRLNDLLAWFEDKKVTYDAQAIEIRADEIIYSGEALAVFAKGDIEEGRVLVTIPKSAVLSIRNTSLRDFLEEHRVGGGLGLVLAVMHEAALGPKSPWFGYLCSLPRREYIPLFWTPEELALLEGTEAAKKAHEDREDTAGDYESEVVPLLNQGRGIFDPAKMTLASFRTAASWIGSRAFGVDDYHGMAMVPFADIFNHKASVVSLGGDFELAGACLGAAGSASEADEPNGSEQENEEGEDHESLSEDPHLDTGEADEDGHISEEASESGDSEGEPTEFRTRGSLLATHLFPEEDLKLHIGICSETRDEEDVLEIVAACRLPAGSEVFNTFGELGNAELVTKYGFALPGNPFDAVRLAKDDVVAEARELLGEAECSRRCRFLEHASELLDEEEDAFEVLPRGQIGPPLLLAVRLLSCSREEFDAVEALDLEGAIQKLLSPAGPDKEDESSSGPAKRRKVAAGKASTDVDPGGGDESSEDAFGSKNVVVAERADWFRQPACQLLLKSIRRREAWRRNGQSGLADLRVEMASARKNMPQGESRAARLAALQILISEKEVLQAARDALTRLHPEN